MAEYITLRWAPRFEGLSRRDREGCSYNAYLPDPLQGWNPTLPGDLAADIADAEAAVRDLNQTRAARIGGEGLARFLLRAESAASSRIEGLAAGPRRLADAEAVIARGGDPADRTAVEILANIAAMETAVELAAREPHLTLDHLLTVHRTLMENSSIPEIAGAVRRVQNWIGGSAYNPCRAAFVPPPPEHLCGLLDDLIGYVNDDRQSPLTQAAIAHAQFETIHPFGDGNGRTGRALIHIVLRRRRLSPAFAPPISLVLAARTDDYIAGLNAFRHLGPADSPGRSTAACEWLGTFAAAVRRACGEAELYEKRIGELAGRWRAVLSPVRSGSTLDLLLGILPGTPLLTVKSAARLTARSEAAAANAVGRLLEAGILIQKNIGRQRYRIFEASDALRLFAEMERSLAYP